MVRVLFVCTGNTCRSPMAEALLRTRLKKIGAADKVSVSSAGIAAWEGEPASPEAVAVMARRGIASIAPHRSHKVNAAQIAAADLILAMTGLHGEKLQATYKEAADKIFLLSEYAGMMGDVADPVGGPLAEYQLCADELDSLIAASLGKILALAGKELENDEK